MRGQLGRGFCIIAIAIPIVLLVLPATRWAVLNHIRMALDWSWGGDRGGDAYGQSPKGTDRASQLAALHEPNRWGNVEAEYQAAKRHWTDPLFLAAFVSEASGDESVAELHPELGRSESTLLPKLLEVCEQGIRIEPGNAFFPAVAAAAQAVGDRVGAQSLLRLAASEPRWSDHAWEITKIERQSYIDHFGYRGWNALSWINERPGLCGDFLAEFARRIAAEPMDAGGIEARQDLYKIAKLSYDQATHEDEMSLGPKILEGLANAKGDWTERSPETIKTLAKQADDLDPNDPGSVRPTVAAMLNSDEEFTQPVDQVIYPWYIELWSPYGIGARAGPIGMIVLLGTLEVAFLAIFAGWALPRQGRARWLPNTLRTLAVIGSFLYGLTVVWYVAMDNKGAARGGWLDGDASKMRAFARQYPFEP